MPNITVSNVLDLVKDYSRNQNLTDARGIRNIDSACDFVFNHIAVPGYELQSTIEFDKDEPYYTAPAGFGEAIFLRYDDDLLNRRSKFTFKPAEMLFEKINAHDLSSRYFGTYQDGTSTKIVIIGDNSVASMTIDNFDSENSTNWTASNDATNISDGEPITVTSGASLQFDIDTTLSGTNRATITSTVDALDLTHYQYNGIFKLKTYLPNITNFTSISLNFGSSLSNYYKVTETTQYDGTAFVVGDNKMQFKFTDATVVGTPDKENITLFWFDYDYTAGFTSTDGIRLDNFRLAYTDNLTLSYYTKYKAKDSGGTYIETLTALTDVFLFGSFDVTFKSVIAMFAAIIINPQILTNDEPVNKLYKSFTTVMSRKYPRKKINNLLIEPKVSTTTQSTYRNIRTI